MSKKIKERKDKDLVSVQPEMLSIVDSTDLDSLDYDGLVELGLGINEIKGYSKWLLGKLGARASVKYGDLKRYANDIHEVYESLHRYVGAYKKYTSEDPNFNPEDYHNRVPWGMILLVAENSDTPVTLLNELTDKGVNSVEGAYREIKTKETGVEVPHKPRINLYWDSYINKWKIDIKQTELPLIDWSDVKDQLLHYLESIS